MSDERTPTADQMDDDEEQDDTVQGVAKRGERDRAEAQRIQDEQNAAAGLNPPDAPPTEPTDPAPAPEGKAPRKPSGA
jgi:hypothetical protein